MEGLEGADGAADAVEVGAELTAAAVLSPPVWTLVCPLVHPANRTRAATHVSDAPRIGVICSG